jgi:hypothetical protein
MAVGGGNLLPCIALSLRLSLVSALWEGPKGDPVNRQTQHMFSSSELASSNLNVLCIETLSMLSLVLMECKYYIPVTGNGEWLLYLMECKYYTTS